MNLVLAEIYAYQKQALNKACFLTEPISTRRSNYRPRNV